MNIPVRETLAESQYRAIRFSPDTAVEGAITRWGNPNSRTYAFADGSRLTVIRGGSAKVRTSDGICFLHGKIAVRALSAAQRTKPKMARA